MSKYSELDIGHVFYVSLIIFKNKNQKNYLHKIVDVCNEKTEINGMSTGQIRPDSFQEKNLISIFSILRF